MVGVAVGQLQEVAPAATLAAMGSQTAYPETRKITKNDVDFERAEQWGRFRVSCVRGIAAVTGLYVSQFPLRWLAYCIKDLAGKQTTVSFGLTITLSVYGVASLLTIITGARKLNRQKRQLIDLRERSGRLEGHLAELRRRSGS
jgi:hypothetical protein